MRLISCHIENFGRLHEYDHDFSEGCNYIVGHNGWGKSTLAAFIRVMLYGFEGEKKRIGHENERKRWLPWQGGVYGGSITFAYNGRTYKATRIFGAKAADDKFELRDAFSNLKLEDFSEQLGEELLGVNSESFMRTVYIGQNDVTTATTDGINAKIGNIADDSQDIDCFEKTVNRLNALLNQNSPSRVTGSIYRLRNEIMNLQSEIQTEGNLSEDIERLEKTIAEQEKSLTALADYMEANVSGQRRMSEYKDVQAVMQVYEKIVEDCREKTEEADNRRSRLPQELPKESEIKEHLEIAKVANNLRGQARGCEVDAKDIEYLAKLREKYSEGLISEDELIKIQHKWKDREMMLIDEASSKASIKVARAEVDSKLDNLRAPGRAFLGLAFVGAALIMALVAVFFSPKPLYMYAGIGMSVAVAMCGILFAVLIINNHKADMEDICARRYDEIAEQEKKLDDRIDMRLRLEKEVEKFFGDSGLRYSVDSVMEDIHDIRSEMDSYERILVRQKEYYEVLGEYEKTNGQVKEYLKGLGVTEDCDATEILSNMLHDIKSYEEASLAANNALRARERYEKEKDIETLKQVLVPEKLPEMAVLTEEYDQMNREALDISNSLKDNRHRLEAMYEKKSLLEDKINRLEELKEKHKKAEENYHNLELTSKYLSLAKESMTSRYMGPIKKSFDKYYDRIAGKNADIFRMDANINLSVEQMGAQHDIDLLSTGYRDLIGFCMRLSLIDAMYAEEKPMLILDDPFVNLDSAHKEKANELVRELAKDYQLICFTCN